jgi:hypothetical protein
LDEFFTEWKCKLCGFSVWRYTLVKEKKTTRVEFPHSKIHPDGDDPPCSGWLSRTGKTREGYVDEVLSPGAYANKYPKIKVNYAHVYRPERAETSGVR